MVFSHCLLEETENLMRSVVKNQDTSDIVMKFEKLQKDTNQRLEFKGHFPYQSISWAKGRTAEENPSQIGNWRRE
jgi:hypothetical protein